MTDYNIVIFNNDVIKEAFCYYEDYKFCTIFHITLYKVAVFISVFFSSVFIYYTQRTGT